MHTDTCTYADPQNFVPVCLSKGVGFYLINTVGVYEIRWGLSGPSEYV